MLIPDSSIVFKLDITFRPKNNRSANYNSRLFINVEPDTGCPFANVGLGNNRRLFVNIIRSNNFPGIIY